MYKDLLINSGLNENEAIIYEFLLKSGKISAGEIIKKTPLKRGVTYNALATLEKRGLISQKMETPNKDAKKIAYFTPEHPNKLRDLMKAKEEDINKAKNTLEANIGTLTSDFNLVLGKPGVRFFEGLEGVKKVINDTLNAKEQIYTYADTKAVIKYINKINLEYVKKRDALGIKKRMIVLDSPFTRDYLKNYYKDITDIRLIDHTLYAFNSVMQIYDGKISYITLSETNMIGVIIEDKNIYQMHKSLFEFAWSHAKNLDQLSPLSNAQ